MFFKKVYVIVNYKHLLYANKETNMTNTIADLWNGSLEPKGCSKTNYFEIKDLDMLINQNLDKLEKVLDKKSKEVFTSYRDGMEEYAYLYGEQAFCDGFCLGVKLAAEALLAKAKRQG